MANRIENATRQKQAVYKAILEFFAKHGYPPTYRELSAAVGLAFSGINRYIQLLLEDGEIEIRHKKDVYPKGLPNRVAEIVRYDFEDILKKKPRTRVR